MPRFVARTARFLAAVAALVLGVAGLTGAACWLLGWRTWDHYGLALTAAAGLTLALAGPSLFGSASMLGNPLTWYVHSLAPGTPRQRWHALLDDSSADAVSLPLLAAAAASLGAAGLWVLSWP